MAYQDLINCRFCDRLAAYREEVARVKKKSTMNTTYWGKPVPGFGDLDGQVLVVGLAPGAHGSNRTGRMFTGDASGGFLYPALFRAGFASQPESTHIGDGMQLKNMFITSVCRCVPPQNKPLPSEIRKCSQYLEYELSHMKNLKIIVSLGSIAQRNIQKYYSSLLGEKVNYPFQHGRYDKLSGNYPFLISSYHPSRQNTQTGRLTIEMFDQIWITVNTILDNNMD